MDIESLKTFSKNDHYNGFTVTKARAIVELNCYLTELTHDTTGARVMHLATKDPENFFCISFQTLPDSSNGSPHILEHTVLCGSRKYPVKDPFFSMQRRSLNTFMNALTGSDFTCYPAASQVEQDFYNLFEVYLDSVFNPLLTELSFSQEGHRLEFAIPDDSTSQLMYKGIVYNEMKGAMSSPNARLHEAINQSLFPDSPYALNSGGEPDEIPNLSYEELLGFHKRFYHPSRALFFFSGNLPLQKHLDFLVEKTLSSSTKLSPLAPIAPIKRYSHPVKKTCYYPIAPDETEDDKVFVSFSWLTCPISDQVTLTMLSILDSILMDTDASILKRALLQSGLCKQAFSMMDSEISEIPYGIVVKGCKANDIEKIESLIFDTLEKIIQDGIDFKKIDTALHQLELYKSEITGDSAPYGLSLFYRSALLRQHGVEPENGLLIHSLFTEIRAIFTENPHHLNTIIQKYLLSNKHFVRVTMLPDTLLGEKEQNRELEKLKKIQEKLSQKEIDEIINNACLLEDLQEKKEPTEKLDLLPKVLLSDISKKARTLDLVQMRQENCEVFHHATFTNKITYLTKAFPIPKIPEDKLWLLRLFSVVISQIGTKNNSYHETLDQVQEHTGGISCYLTLHNQVQGADHFAPYLHIRSKAMHHKAFKMFSLLFDMITEPNFSEKGRIKEIILKHYTSMHTSIVSHAMRYAMNLSATSLSKSGKLLSTWYGLEYLQKIKSIADSIDESIDSLIKEFQWLKEKIFSVSNSHLILCSEQTEFTKYLENGFEGLTELPIAAHTPWNFDQVPTPAIPQGRIISSQVAFTSSMCKSVPFSHTDSAAISLATSLLDNTVLHKRIREQGGAYGGGSIANPMSETFCFYAYRDPNIFSTLQAFDEALLAISNGTFSEDELVEAKLEMIQNLDSPIAPGSRADVAYNWHQEGKTYAIRQAFRDRLLATTKESIQKAVSEHLVPNMQKASVASFSSKELLEKENEKLIQRGKKALHLEKVWS